MDEYTAGGVSTFGRSAAGAAAKSRSHHHHREWHHQQQSGAQGQQQLLKLLNMPMEDITVGVQEVEGFGE
uniref:Uncharacterized protein n=1 Tax=Ditylenchus dipsaci TaxID=166011 RepID=A0A915CY81_9BILA